MKTHRLLQLDGLRFFMIVTIILSHFDFIYRYSYGKIYGMYFDTSTLAVDYFFMLSGFGLMYDDALKSVSTLSLKCNNITFAIDRIKKIYPLYVFSLILSVPYDIIPISANAVLKEFILFCSCLSLSQSITGMYKFPHAINAVCWFLSTLFICYIFVPFFIKICNNYIKNMQKIFITTAFAITIIIILTLLFAKMDGANIGFDALTYTSPFIRCFYVFLGMIIAKLHILIKDNRNIRKSSLIFFEYSIVAIAFIYTLFRNSITLTSIQKRFFDIIICFFMLLIISFGYGKISKILSKPTLTKLGQCAMYPYLLHYPCVRYIDRIFTHYDININGNITCIIEIITIIISTILLSLVAKNIINWLNNPVRTI